MWLIKTLTTCLILSFLPLTGLSLSTDIPNGPKWDAFDKTTASPETMPMDQMIIVTVSSNLHQSLVGKGSVKSKPLPNQYEIFLKEVESLYGVTRMADWPLHALNEHCFVFKAASAQARNQALKKMRADQRFLKVTKMNRFESKGQKAKKNSTYNDPFIGLQHGLRALNIPPLHLQKVRGQDTLVAVIDTGVDINHPEMKGRLFGTKNVVDKDDKQFIKDYHGTAIVSIIAANANNKAGVVGIAPESKILAIKACWEKSQQDHTAICSSFNIIKALDFALKQKAQIINMSLAGPSDEILEALVKKAEEEGALIIGAIDPNNASTFPANHPSVLAIAQPKAYQKGTRVDALAPGKQIISALPNNEYEFFSGNSFSTAHVSGVVALIQAHSPQIPMKDIRLAVKKYGVNSHLLDTCSLFKALKLNVTCSPI